MIERVIENWLTRVNERSFEVPFCQLLAGEGYQVVHLTRHGPAEEGKDILAIAPDGVPCAFQLKGASNGKITQKDWEEFAQQINRLVEIPIMHPSIDRNQPRRVYLVTNGEVDEEVRLEIEHRNLGWVNRGYPQLETIVKGQLLKRFELLHSDLWPLQLTFEKTLLELFLADGTSYLQKAKFANFIQGLLPLSETKVRKSEFARTLASTAIFASYSLAPYEEKSNHVALIEGWTIYLGCLVALVENYGLAESYWKEAFAISIFAIEEAFVNLCEELKTRKSLVEGNELVDNAFYRGRITWLVGLVSAFALYKRLEDHNWVINDWFKTFVNSHENDLQLWGEAAIPQFLAIFWFSRLVTGTPKPDFLLARLIDSICEANDGKESVGLPDPYHNLGEVALDQIGLSGKTSQEHFRGQSYTLESLIHLFARRNWRQSLRFLWSNITHIHYVEFCPKSAWEFCLWYCENGILRTAQPKMPQSWTELKRKAAEVDISLIPKLFQQYPPLLLLFILVFPHRLTKDVAKFLDDCVSRSL